MPARNGSAEWRGNLESGSGTGTDDEVDRSRGTPPVSLLIPRDPRRLGLVLEYLRSRDRVARPGNEAGRHGSSDLGESRRYPA